MVSGDSRSEQKKGGKQKMGIPDFKISMAAARVNAKLTQKEFADLCGVRVETVNSWEQGKTEPPVSAIRKLSEKSNIPMDFIFCGKD